MSDERQNTKRLKVCGMREPENILSLAALLPDYIGFIFYGPSKRFAGELDRSVLQQLPRSIKKTGVFVDAGLDEILEKKGLYNLDAIQLHGKETAELCQRLRDNQTEVIKAFGMDENFNFAVLNEYKDVVDYFLFDTKTKLHGGSGQTFDWNLLNAYSLDIPYFLSGGLDADNIEQAVNIKDDRFYALDLNSRFEISPGLKDIRKLSELINRIQTKPNRPNK